MRIFLILFILMTCYTSCKSTKRAKGSKSKTSKTIPEYSESDPYNNASNSLKVFTLQDRITDYAKTFVGVKYKWGGTTKSGMDCSGLVFESFREHRIFLPRISRDMAKKGLRIDRSQVEKGDLLFFKTGKSRRQAINHVGLVVEVSQSDIAFIHSTTKKGVMISRLSDHYWYSAFIEARRYL